MLQILISDLTVKYVDTFNNLVTISTVKISLNRVKLTARNNVMTIQVTQATQYN